MSNIPSIIQLQTELDNSFKPQYKLESYLGHGKNSYIYRGITNSNHMYLIKFIPKDKYYQRNIVEVGFIKALSLFNDSKNYINTCRDFSMGDKYIIVIMDVFRGQNMNQFSNHIKNLHEYEYLDIIKQIIKQSLMSLSYIHKRGVAHQNLSLSNLVLSCPDGKNIKYLKLVDFGSSCGYYFDVHNKKFMNKKCKYIVDRIDNLPPEYYRKEELITQIQKLMKANDSKNVELYMAKKDDLWVLGTIFWSLVNRPNIGNNPFTNHFPESNKLNRANYREFHGSAKLKKMHEFIIDNILVPVHTRKSANEILGKFLILEKYGWEFL
jgi:serine/threonine protein kinase